MRAVVIQLNRSGLADQCLEQMSHLLFQVQRRRDGLRHVGADQFATALAQPMHCYRHSLGCHSQPRRCFAVLAFGGLIRQIHPLRASNWFALLLVSSFRFANASSSTVIAHRASKSLSGVKSLASSGA